MLQEKPEVTYLTRENFVEEVRKHEGIILIEAYAVHNGLSHLINPVISEVKEEYNIDLKYCRFDINEEPYVTMKLKVKSAPAFVIVLDGHVFDRIHGLVPKKLLLNKLKIAIRSSESIRH